MHIFDYFLFFIQMFGIIKTVLRDIFPSSHRKWEKGTVLPPVTFRGVAQEMPWRHSEWAGLCPHGEGDVSVLG